MIIKTFVLLFDSAEFCYHSHGERDDSIENNIQEAIDKYCSLNKVVECDRKITTTLCEGNGYFVVTVTSKFEKGV